MLSFIKYLLSIYHVAGAALSVALNVKMTKIHPCPAHWPHRGYGLAGNTHCPYYPEPAVRNAITGAHC